jgi:hypothetical protein
VLDTDNTLKVCQFEYELPLQNVVSFVHTTNITQAYAHAKSVEDLQGLLAMGPLPMESTQAISEEILDYRWYPPLPNINLKPANIVCPMKCVEFSTQWLSSQLESQSGGLSKQEHHWVCHLVLMMHAHIEDEHAGIKSHFMVKIWPTTGVMNSSMHTIAWGAFNF